MKKIIAYTLLAVPVCCGQTPIVYAESALTMPITHIVISEVQTGGLADATEEFVELYNPTDQTVDVTGWQLQYRAASNTAAQTWPGATTKATLTCPAGSPADCAVTIMPDGRLVLVHTIGNIAGALPMTGGFSDKGGEIRLIQPATAPIVHDFVGYGTAADSEGPSPAPAPMAGKSIKRVIAANGSMTDTNNNQNDFIADCGSPTPGLADSSPIPYATGCAEPPTSTPPDTNNIAPNEQPGQTDPGAPDGPAEPGKGEGPKTYLPILITEVLPDPATPQQDSTDEFIELFNPNDITVSLKDYTLLTGESWRYHFTLGDTLLGPHDYASLSSAVTKLSLSNSGSGVRLIDPSGTIAYEAPNYGDAKESQSWMQDDTGWHWTLTPTPNAPNILTVPASAPISALSAGTAKKKTAAKVATVTAPKIPKAPKAPAATKKTATKAGADTTNPAQNIASVQPLAYWILAPVGALVAGYAAYEYRQEIARGARTVWTRLSGNRSDEPKAITQGEPD